MLLVAAALNFAVALLHVAIVIVGPDAYLFFGAGPKFATAAADGLIWPHLVTLALTAIFAIWGLICLSYAGVLRRLPLVGIATFAIGAVYLLRGVAVVPQAIGFEVFHGGDGSIDPKDLISSTIALGIGVVHLLGWWQQRQKQRS